MISVSEARKIIQDNTDPLPAKTVPLQDAAGLVLARDVISPINIPSFDQSSVDGYAFAFGDLATGKKMKITGMIPAGSGENIQLEQRTAMRIYTGAPLPAGADTVVMQEKAKVENDELTIEDEDVQLGMNRRTTGIEIRKDSVALSEGLVLNPAAIGVLASIGTVDVVVYPKPGVSLIVTGEELQQPGKVLKHGQVYEANSVSIKAALQQQGIYGVKIFYAGDSLETIAEMLRLALQETDLVFLTGGISVGDFDFVLQATINNGIRQLFHKIKQRPAKPLYFGKKENKYVFGLPGNPASGLTAFYEYALPAIGILCKQELKLTSLKVPLAKSFRKKPGLTHFLKGSYDGNTATVLGAQESFRLSSFAKANCLVQIDEDVTECQPGEAVEIHLLPRSL